jgi:hypothetical protein
MASKRRICSRRSKWLDHIVHWEGGELIASHQTAVFHIVPAAWSRDGTLLALDMGTQARFAGGIRLIWDARTDQIREPTPHERWQFPWSSQWQSRDLLRWFESPVTNFGFNCAGMATAWCPDDPDVFATLGRDGASGDIRIWRRVK